MLRNLALLLVLVPAAIFSQDAAKVQRDRTKALDAAATTPFFTARGAAAVKRVIAGADAMKNDEKVTDPLDAKSAAQPGGKAAGAPAGQQAPGALPAPQQRPAAPAPDPVFGWRLVGISYGKKQGMALFRTEGRQQTVVNGASLDPDTKILAISRSKVRLEFHGKKLDLTPW